MTCDFRLDLNTAGCKQKATIKLIGPEQYLKKRLIRYFCKDHYNYYLPGLEAAKEKWPYEVEEINKCLK